MAFQKNLRLIELNDILRRFKEVVKRDKKNVIYLSESTLKWVDRLIRLTALYQTRQDFVLAAVQEKINNLPMKSFHPR